MDLCVCARVERVYHGMRKTNLRAWSLPVFFDVSVSLVNCRCVICCHAK